jgi:uncharacterized membrane protein YgcG
MKRLAAGILSTIAILALSTAVLAADPPKLTQTVTDQTGKLAGGEARIAAAATSLKSDHNLILFVLFVNSLDGEDPGQFVDRVAAANNLSAARNVLVMVSLNDRKDALWSSAQTSVTADELTTIRNTALEPKLKSGDFVGAVEAAAVGLGNADATTAAPPAAQQPSAPSQPIDLTPVLLFFVIVIAAVVALWLLWLGGSYAEKRLAKRAAARAEYDKMEALGKQAHVALMQSDEQVRAAEQELAFAQAEFGADEVAPFVAALAVAKKQLQDAFKIGQQIDDETPESYDERSQMLAQIADQTSGIDKAMADQTVGVERLRDLETNAASTVKTLIAAKPDRDKDLADAQTILDNLNVHAKSIVDPVSQNVDVATALYAQVDKSLADAQTEIDGGQTAPAALLLRGIQDSLAKAKTALDAVTKMGAVFDQASRGLDAEIKSADAEIVKAAAAVKAGKVAGLDSKMSEAQSSLAEAKQEAVSAHADLVAAYNSAVQANQIADQVLDGVRTAQEREQRAVAAAQAQMRAAQASLTQANAYVTSNGSAVTRKTRTKLSEAQRRYDEASGINDVFAAATAAAVASDLADSAYRSAREDVSASQPVYSGGSYGSSSSSGGYGASDSSSSSSSGSWAGSSSSSSNNDSFSIGSFGGGFSSGGGFGGGGGGASSGGGW